MIGDGRVVALVPARAGSRGIPQKNLRQVGGVSLLERAISIGLDCPEVDRVVVSTDGEDIAAAATSAGAEVIDRPDELSGDDVIVADVVRHVLDELRRGGETARYMVLLEPTAPLRTVDDVSLCVKRLHEEGLDSVATFTNATLNPCRAWKIGADGRPELFLGDSVPWLPRQRLPEAYQLTGHVYAFVLDKLGDETGLLFGETGSVIVDRHRLVDIDDEIELEIADALIRRLG